MRRFCALLVVGLLATACSSAPPSNTPAASSSSATGSASPSPSASASSSASPANSPGSTPQVAPSAPSTLPPSAAAFACNTPAAFSGGEQMLTYLRDLRVGTHEGYDRLVIEYDSGLPYVEVRRATAPYVEDGSGRELSVAGDIVFEVILRGATRAGPEGDSSYNGPLAFKPDFAQLVDVVPAGDFEAVSRWYVGVRNADCARVSLLSDPARVVIDFAH